MPHYHDNGPRAGRGAGRARNTLRNNASKTLPPPVTPGSAVAFSGQLGVAQMTLAQRLAALRAGKGVIQGQFRMERAGIRAGRIAGQVGAVNQALEAGTVGSSFDLETRARVDADAAAGMQAAIQARVQGLLGLRLDRISATNEFYTTAFDIQARRAAEQAELANREFLEDLVMRLGDETVSAANAAGTSSTPTREPTPEEQARIDWIKNRINAGRL